VRLAEQQLLLDRLRLKLPEQPTPIASNLRARIA
jgi:hypothetical protein